VGQAFLSSRNEVEAPFYGVEDPPIFKAGKRNPPVEDLVIRGGNLKINNVLFIFKRRALGVYLSGRTYGTSNYLYNTTWHSRARLVSDRPYRDENFSHSSIVMHYYPKLKFSFLTVILKFANKNTNRRDAKKYLY